MADPTAPAGDLRERLTVAIEAWFNLPDDLAHNDEMACQVAEVVLAALRQDTGTDMAERFAAKLTSLLGHTWCDHCYPADWAGRAGAAMTGVRDEELWRLQARVEFAAGEMASLRDHGTRWETEKARADKAEAELAEIERVTDPPEGEEEMPTDPAELREMWEFINRQARWQWHMATKFNNGRERGHRRAREAEAQVAALQQCGDEKHTGPLAEIDRLQSALYQQSVEHEAQVAALVKERDALDGRCGDLVEECETRRAATDLAERELAEARNAMDGLEMYLEGVESQCSANRMDVPSWVASVRAATGLAQATTESTEEKTDV